MKIKIDFDPRSEPSTLITLRIHHSRSDRLNFTSVMMDWIMIVEFLTRGIPLDVIFFIAQRHHISKMLITFSQGEEWIMMFAKA